MSDNTVHNLLKGTGETVDSDGYGVVSYKPVEPLVVGREYTVSAYVEELVRTPLPSGVDRPVLVLYDGAGWWSGGNLSGDVPGVQTLTFTYKQPFPGHADPDQIWLFNTPQNDTGVTRRARLRDVMLVEGTEPAAWAPAEGETLAGGVGAPMSANALDGITPELLNGTTQSGIWYETTAGGDCLRYQLDIPAHADNQAFNLAATVCGDSAGWLSLALEYADAAGHTNRAIERLDFSTEQVRRKVAIVIPSGMAVTALYVSRDESQPASRVASIALWQGKLIADYGLALDVGTSGDLRSTWARAGTCARRGHERGHCARRACWI